MKYDLKVFEKVRNEIYNLKILKIEEAKKRQKLLYEKYPEIENYRNIKKSVSAEIAKIIINKQDVPEELKKLKEKVENLNKKIEKILKFENLNLSYFEINYNCKICDDTGFKRNGTMCDCFKELLKKENVKNLREFENFKFEDFDLKHYSFKNLSEMKIILNFCKDYAKKFNFSFESVVMTGKTGLGKTHLAIAIADVLIGKNFSVIYSSFPEIVANLEKSRFSKNFNYDNLIDCDFLILDDFGEESRSNFSNSIVYNIINNRILLKKPYIIITNLSVAEVEINYSEKIFSRILGSCKILCFVGKDMRVKKSYKT
ncbi:MAG: DNA replication protein DnaC [Candidatus Paraimprobicoccus trichonymphae]|uniref:DNA replication protein DnaC n=1 Tax=Candidatus Paraimprobicoccus trichonymphae TaxID=3033793 RepID=A0AA48L1G4_9FIRM|nr:MAG: DNA replication protein DnaC [Candidatus Paraimprobicoccus trichonymphae]